MEYTALERDWLRLSAVDGVGNRRMMQLLELCGTPTEVFARAEETEMAFLGKAAWNALKAARAEEYIEALLKRMEKADCRAVTLDSEDYPPLLMQLADPPAVLYVRGEAPLDSGKMIGVVGARKCTRDGRRAAFEISRDLAAKGVTVVSGLARGTDTAAHEGALEGEGRTVAVLGCGVDVVYPPENDRLVARILENGGALVSEYPPGASPLAGHFPARNRIISGLTQGTMIVEGNERSGAMITVNDALEQNRDVFAVPGSIYSALSISPNRLLVEGAKPVTCAWDILEYYRWADRSEAAAPKKAAVELTETEARIVKPLTEQSLSFEELSTITAIPANVLNSHLTMLELRGIIEKVPGGCYRAYL